MKATSFLAVLILGVLSVAPAFTQQTIRLRTGFQNDPYLVDIQLDLDDRISRSYGTLWTHRPVESVFLDYGPGEGALRYDLHISFRGNVDSLLSVRTPDGRILENDDADELDPSVTIPNAPFGDYEISFLAYGTVELEGTLGISEVAPFFDMGEAGPYRSYLGSPADGEYREILITEGEYWIEGGSVFYEPPVTARSRYIDVYVFDYREFRNYMGELDATGRPIFAGSDPDGPSPVGLIIFSVEEEPLETSPAGNPAGVPDGGFVVRYNYATFSETGGL